MYELMQGDCLVEMSRIADGSIDAIICDLPYGTTACAWDSVIPFDALWKHYKRVIKPSGAIVLFGSQPFTSALVMSNPQWFKYSLVWEKTNSGDFMLASYRPRRLHEDISIFSQGAHTYNPQMQKGKPYIDQPRQRSNRICDSTMPNLGIVNDGTRYPSSIQKFANGNNNILHPAQKPTDLLEYLIRTYTNEGETVLDNCFGSGSCGVAAMRTKRRFVGIERDAGYFAIGSKQIEDAARAAAGQPKLITGHPADLEGLPMFQQQ